MGIINHSASQMYIISVTLLLYFPGSVVVFPQEGDRCQLLSGEQGRCVYLSQCPSATNLFRIGISPQICGFTLTDSLLCCEVQQRVPQNITQKITPKITTQRPNQEQAGERISVKGDRCQLLSGEQGRCVHLSQCPSATNLLRIGISPQICRFTIPDSLVCCEVQQRAPQNITPKITTQRLTQEQPGNLSLAKCDEFYPKLNFGGIFVVGGEKSLAKEFPHMAAIGYRSKNDTQWLCGGSLISYDYILTAAHCLESLDHGPARWVRLGELDFATDKDDAEPQDFSVKRRIQYPDYNPPASYHDIGLIQLDRRVKRTDYVNIACLDIVRQHKENQLTATGWGDTEHAGRPSTHLLKINLDLVPNERCRRDFRKFRTELPSEVVDDFQICAGGVIRKDTCPGDSGGPLQIRNLKRGSVFLFYDIVGITSFGKACGVSKSPAIYTRVHNYLSWIESTVWPL